MTAQKLYFTGMKNAKINERNDYLEADQKFLLKIKKTFVFETRDKGDAYIAEFEVVKTTSTNPKMAPGRSVSWYQGLTKKDVAFASIKLFCFACLGLDRNKDEKKVESVTSSIEALMQESVEKNSFADVLVVCETSSRVAKTPKIVNGQSVQTTFTNHSWAPASAWS
jgi:hypothetical protein